METDFERSQKLEELAKIKAEIDSLIIEKAQIVNEINVPIYKAKAEAEKILKDAKNEAEIIVKAAKGLKSEAEQQHTEVVELLHTAKGEREAIKAVQVKLEQERVDFNAEKFAHENLIRNKKGELYEYERQTTAASESLQQSLIEVKQREETAIRKETELNTREDFIKQTRKDIVLRHEVLDEYANKIEKQLSEAKQKESETLTKEADLLALQSKIEDTLAENQKILDDIVAQKQALSTQQNDLARQIEILENCKAENDEKAKALKEQVRLNELKIRQNDEKIAVIKQLRDGGTK